MLSEAKQKIFQARWRDKICEKLVQSERERRCNMLSAAKKRLFRRVGATKTLKNWFSFSHGNILARLKKNDKAKKTHYFLSWKRSVFNWLQTRNLFLCGSKKIRSHVLMLFKQGEGTFNLKDLRFNLRLNVFIANDIKNLGGIGIEEVWSKTCNQNLKRKRQVQSWSKSKTPPKKNNLNDSKTIFTFGTKSWTKTQ